MMLVSAPPWSLWKLLMLETDLEGLYEDCGVISQTASGTHLLFATACGDCWSLKFLHCNFLDAGSWYLLLRWLHMEEQHLPSRESVVTLLDWMNATNDEGPLLYLPVLYQNYRVLFRSLTWRKSLWPHWAQRIERQEILLIIFRYGSISLLQSRNCYNWIVGADLFYIR
jgi:hypothetical protein